jgi:uncharacterized caspase-like protein
MRRNFTAIVLLGGALACRAEPAEQHDLKAAPEQPDSPAPSPETTLNPEQQHAAVTDALLETFDALAELHQRHAHDCPALAGAIAEFHAQHQARLSVPNAILEQIDADEALRARLRSAMESIMSASMVCRDDPAFKAVQIELFGA